MTIEEIAFKYGLCNCAEIYTSRGLTAPDCPYHAFCVWEAMEEYGKQEAVGFYHWSARNAYYITAKERWYLLPSNPVYTSLEAYTDVEIYSIYEQQKQK